MRYNLGKPCSFSVGHLKYESQTYDLISKAYGRPQFSKVYKIICYSGNNLSNIICSFPVNW